MLFCSFGLSCLVYLLSRDTQTHTSSFVQFTRFFYAADAAEADARTAEFEVQKASAAVLEERIDDLEQRAAENAQRRAANARAATNHVEITVVGDTGSLDGNGGGGGGAMVSDTTSASATSGGGEPVDDVTHRRAKLVRDKTIVPTSAGAEGGDVHDECLLSGDHNISDDVDNPSSPGQEGESNEGARGVDTITASHTERESNSLAKRIRSPLPNAPLVIAPVTDATNGAHDDGDDVGGGDVVGAESTVTAITTQDDGRDSALPLLPRTVSDGDSDILDVMVSRDGSDFNEAGDVLSDLMRSQTRARVARHASRASVASSAGSVRSSNGSIDDGPSGPVVSYPTAMRGTSLPNVSGRRTTPGSPSADARLASGSSVVDVPSLDGSDIADVVGGGEAGVTLNTWPRRHHPSTWTHARRVDSILSGRDWTHSESDPDRPTPSPRRSDRGHSALLNDDVDDSADELGPRGWWASAEKRCVVLASAYRHCGHGIWDGVVLMAGQERKYCWVNSLCREVCTHTVLVSHSHSTTLQVPRG